MGSSPMEKIGECNGVTLYFANSRFEEPGVYYWDGKSNVRAWPREESPTPDAAARVRELFGAMLTAPYGDTTMGDIVCAETTRNRLESSWLPIIERALTTPSDAGGECEPVGTVMRVPADCDFMGVAQIGWHRTIPPVGTKLYLTPPNSGDARLRDSLNAYLTMRDAVGGCTDGGCVIKRPKGMHTNGGCKCWHDKIKSQRMMRAGQSLADELLSLLDGKGEGRG